MQIRTPLLLLVIATTPAAAQSGNTTDTAFFRIVGESVQVARLPISYTVRPLEGHRWGAKLRFPVTIGFHEFTASDVFGGELQQNLATISGLAGVEFQIPTGPRWMLLPYAEFGAGTDLDGGDVALLYGAGLNFVRESKQIKPLYRLGLGLNYEGATLTNGGPSNGFTTGEVGLDVRFPTSRTLGKRQLDWSVYGIRRRFLSELSFDQLGGDPITLRDQNEVGFTLGLDRPWSLWLLHIDRIGLGFRFGDRLNSVRILFGVPF